ncbi:MAG: exosortase/archaeosortase family protein [Candidatus Hydrogenedentes bacterium]|nr:exosortase/archaeosortase family protein [Candidatus Hydrogenedentota bacterium]
MGSAANKAIDVLVMHAHPKIVPPQRVALQTLIGFSWVLASVAAVWAAAPELWIRWFAPWGSPMGAVIALFAVGAWLFLITGPSGGPLRVAPARGWLIAAVVLLGLYALTWPTAPQLVRCELAAGIVGCTMMGTLASRSRRGAWGIAVLMLLCVHVATSLDFFIGFPLRVASSNIAAFMLGPEIRAEGTALSNGATTFFVDAPCSGVRMLSASIAMGAGVAVLYQFNPLRTALLIAISFALAIFGNAHRAATLYVAGIGPDYPEHGVLGIIVFAECALLLLVIANGIRSWKRLDARRHLVWPRLPAGRLLSVCFVMGCVVAGVRSGVSEAASKPSQVSHRAIAWPQTWNGKWLEPVEETGAMKAWLQDVPGQSAQFRWHDGKRHVLLRLCDGPTRDLHSAQNCYLAQGGTCTPQPTFRDEAGRLWSRFWYRGPDGSQTSVRECYIALNWDHPQGGELNDWLKDTESWPDASAWYWASAISGERGRPTLAITVAE